MGPPAATGAALVLTIMPSAALYNRLAFAYNVEAVFVVLEWWALWRFSADRGARSLLAASLAAACAYMTALAGLPLVLCVALVTLWLAPRHFLWSSMLMALPGLAYLVVLYWIAPAPLAQDLVLTFGRTSGSLGDQLLNLATNYSDWFNTSPWLLLGVAGLFLLEPRPVRVLSLLVFFLPLFGTMRAFTGGDLNFHRYLALLPIVALGAAQFLRRAYAFLWIRLRRDLQGPRWLQPTMPIFQRLHPQITALVVALVLLIPLAWTALWDMYLVSSSERPRPTSIDFVMARHPRDARDVIHWLNATCSREDVILASPTIAWAIRANAADFQQALSYEGVQTDNYGPALAHDRFAFAPSFENATFVVVDDLWRGWAVERMPPLRKYLDAIQTWPLLLHQGEFDVYRNPAR